ncbi:MAG: proteasome assembly chaperone family protein, partial [Candidatus Omnitrophica bacterium]|nr:proteasome assembly chaperone family protein [Candidatus Omnitrophota bacterium]
MIKEITVPKLKSPIFILAWPGMGEVAYKSALFLKEALRFKMFAKLEAGNFFKPAAVIVEKGIAELPAVPAGFFYYFKAPKAQRATPDLLLFVGEAQPPLERGEEFARVIMEYAKKFKPQMVISFAAKPEAIDHKSEPSLWVVATHPQLLETFKKFNIKVLLQGQISGLNGLILGVAKQFKVKGICLLAEIPIYTVQIENPKASGKILKVLDKYLRLNLNLMPLTERARFIEEEIDKLIAYLKGEPLPQGPLPLSEEDIEKIKKDLAAYTKLPQSAREKIEALFKEAKKDISKAREL